MLSKLFGRRKSRSSKGKGKTSSILDSEAVDDAESETITIDENSRETESPPDPVLFGESGLDISAFRDDKATNSPAHQALPAASSIAAPCIQSPNGNVVHAMETAKNRLEQISSLTDVWGPLLDKLNTFVSMMDGFSEVHPYAKMATALLLGAVKIFISQVERDAAVQKLFEKMYEVYDHVVTSETLKHLDDHRKAILQQMALQTVECAYFIQHMSKVKNFWSRAVQNVFSGNELDTNIASFVTSFEELKRSFSERTVLQVEISVFKVLEALDDIGMKVELQELPRARNAGMMPLKACHPDTRIDTLETLTQWVNSVSDRRVYFLLGGAGTGKSAIAHAIGKRFQKLRRLGSLFCFDRTFQGDRHPESVFCTIARDLADWSPSYKQKLSKVLREDGSLAYTADIITQWNEFILKPASHLVDAIVGPVLIVIDALDESGHSASRRLLLSLLANQSINLPPNFRILVTSRPEPDVIESILHRPVPVDCMNLSNAKLEASRDILIYIRDRLSAAPTRLGRLNDWDYQQLADKSEGLFQWAFTACEAILDPRKGGLSLKDRFRRLLQSADASELTTNLKDDLKPLNSLYAGILGQAFNPNDDEVMERYRSIMAQILGAFEPLSVKTLEQLRRFFGHSEDSDDTALILPEMGSLLVGVADQDVSIQPYHTSFRDFLATKEKSGVWYVDAQSGHFNMAFGSLLLLNKHLCFNICKLSSSFHLTNSISSEDLGKHISPPLRYACKYWGLHVTRLQDSHLLNSVQTFITGKLLFWLEAMSLLQAVGSATSNLIAVDGWLSMLNLEEDHTVTELQHIVQDAIKFIRYFSPVILTNAQHIYISALSFAPKSSLVSRIYAPRFQNIATILIGQLLDWPAERALLTGHEAGVFSVAFSINNKLATSGSWDGSIRIWDTETQEMIYGPFEVDNSGVTSVAFSLDSTRVVSGCSSGLIRIWNVEKGEAVGGRLSGHKDRVIAISYFPDGRRILSGSLDRTIRIWNADSGQTVAGPFDVHDGIVLSMAFSSDCKLAAVGSYNQAIRICSVETGQLVSRVYSATRNEVEALAISPDGKRVVSGSSSKIEIWDIETGHSIVGPVQGHKGRIKALAFSPSGMHIASGSTDKTVRVWDAVTMQKIAGPLEGHNDRVKCVAFSSDSKRIASASWDKSIRIWDTHTGETVQGTFTGHRSAVLCLACSNNGKFVASGSSDRTIRLWDAHTGEMAGRPLEGHSGEVSCIAFSPDSRCIASGSYDRTIRIWDVRDVHIIGGPFSGHQSWICSIAFSVDNNTVASISFEGSIRIWDLNSGNISVGPLTHAKKAGFVARSFNAEATYVLAFSPDGKTLISCSLDQEIYLWDVETGQILLHQHRHFEDPKPILTSAMTVSANHDRVVFTSLTGIIELRLSTVWLCSIAEAEDVSWSFNFGYITCMSISSDGKLLAVGSSDGNIEVFDIETRQALPGQDLFLRDNSSIKSLAFMPNGQKIVSASDTSIRFWDLGTGTWPGLNDKESSVTERDGWIKGPDCELPGTVYHHVKANTGDKIDEESNSREERADKIVRPKQTPTREAESGKIMWIPPIHRQSLHRPHTTRVIAPHETRIDFSRAVWGSKWELCYTPEDAENTKAADEPSTSSLYEL